MSDNYKKEPWSASIKKKVKVKTSWSKPKKIIDEIWDKKKNEPKEVTSYLSSLTIPWLKKDGYVGALKFENFSYGIETVSSMIYQ